MLDGVQLPASKLTGSTSTLSALIDTVIIARSYLQLFAR
jgi:hypothetical protein